MRRLSLLFVILLLVLSAASFSSADSFTGRVLDVHDGDTITVLKQDNQKLKIRLAGIDCPETFQVHGEAAKQFVLSKVSDRRVRIEPETIDRYGRTVGIVLINGENLNEQIVANGHGWVYRKYCKADYCKNWLKLEETKRDAQVGLWENENPEPPWEWRSRHRDENNNRNGSVDSASSAASSTAAAGVSSSIIYHGNRRSHVFHGPSCVDYNCKNCTVTLGSYQEAVGAGFRAHRECVSE
jgi:endonuclease YncB( thermonuclease family)